MKILDSNEYINEKLNIQPVTKDRLSDYKKPSVDKETIRFIEEKNLIWNPLSKCYDCGGNVRVLDDMVIDGKLKIKFGKVGGGFDCSNNKLTTLEGAPQEVRGGFYCNNNNLTSLECAPQKVGGNFNCSSNNLTSLECAPQKVGGDFYCRHNPNLVLPEGKPSWLKGEIYD